MPDLKQKTQALIAELGGDVPETEQFNLILKRLRHLDDAQIRQLLLQLDEDVLAHVQRIAVATAIVRTVVTLGKFARLLG